MTNLKEGELEEEVLCFIDSPLGVTDIQGRTSFYLKGWVASNELISLRITINDKEYKHKIEAREDVAAVYSNKFKCIVGFCSEINFSDISEEYVFTAAINIYDAKNKIIFKKTVEVPLLTEVKEENIKLMKAWNEKQDFIRKNLVCPNCFSGLLKFEGKRIVCEECGKIYDYDKKPSMLTQKIIEESKIVDTSNVSSHSYDKTIVDIISTNPEKMYLDAGAGLRNVYYKNVVNLEITNYWTTDIIASGEAIPFADETFDGVFSVAVMEHVPNFFKYVENILRVVKKGGVVFCAVPFMQPEHGYPYHFYNMTHEGLLNLFRQDTQIQESGFVKEAFHPINSLKWMLGIYYNGLKSNAEKSKFYNMKVGEIIDMENEMFSRIASSKNIEESEYRKICGGSYILAVKK